MSDNPSHFEVLYRRYWKPVVRFCAARLPGCPAGLAEDVAQEVFLIAHQALAAQRYHQEGALSTWLYGIARHRCAKAQRARYRHATSPELRQLVQELAQWEQAGGHPWEPMLLT
jgi:RNA polymerase sigma factor (sigma-70 family)